MAMNGATLGSQIADIITASDASDEMKAQIRALWQEIATAVVAHIQANAQVTVTVATTGTASAQTGTGTGTVA